MKTLQIQKEKINYRTTIVWFLAIALAATLVYAATKKVMDLQAFAAHLKVLPMVTPVTSYLLTGIIILIEYSLAFALLFYPLQRWLYFSVAGLMILYSLYIFAILNFALYLPCSCQGAFKSLSWQQHYLVNLGVLLLALGILLIIRNKKGHEHLRNKHQRYD